MNIYGLFIPRLYKKAGASRGNEEAMAATLKLKETDVILGKYKKQSTSSLDDDFSMHWTELGHCKLAKIAKLVSKL